MEGDLITRLIIVVVSHLVTITFGCILYKYEVTRMMLSFTSLYDYDFVIDLLWNWINRDQ